jgi:hypothetical protein
MAKRRRNREAHRHSRVLSVPCIRSSEVYFNMPMVMCIVTGCNRAATPENPDVVTRMTVPTPPLEGCIVVVQHRPEVARCIGMPRTFRPVRRCG